MNKLFYLSALVGAFLTASLYARNSPDPAEPNGPDLAWHDVTSWGVEGRAWPELERQRWFDRLPAVANGMVTEKVWSLSRNTNSWILPQRDAYHTAKHAALRECYEQLLDDGVTGLDYVPGDNLLGHDGEGATDGSHPSDLGFVRQADIFEPVLRAALIGREL